jgi:hypothetical protein
MIVPEWIPFGFGALILLWGLWSAIFAFSGGQESGLHQIIAPQDRVEPDLEADREERRRREEESRRRWTMLGQVGNFLIAGFVTVAAIAMVIAATVIGH